jgi:hypothetical protein
MKEKIRKGRCQAQFLFPNYGTARRDPLQRALVDRFGVVEMLIGERQGLPGLPLLQVFLHKLRLF